MRRSVSGRLFFSLHSGVVAHTLSQLVVGCIGLHKIFVAFYSLYMQSSSFRTGPTISPGVALQSWGPGYQVLTSRGWVNIYIFSKLMVTHEHGPAVGSSKNLSSAHFSWHAIVLSAP